MITTAARERAGHVSEYEGIPWSETSASVRKRKLCWPPGGGPWYAEIGHRDTFVSADMNVFFDTSGFFDYDFVFRK